MSNTKNISLYICACFLALSLIPHNVVWSADKKIPVFVSILPQSYFVKQIGGDMVDVKVLVQPGHSPATYEPTPRQMADLSQATIFFRIGVPFENSFLPKIKGLSNKLEIINTRKGIKLREMKAHSHDDHDKKDHDEKDNHEEHDNHKKHEKHEEGHHHSGNDPHVWLNPLLVKIQGRHITDTLGRIDPERKAIYEKNYGKFTAEMDKLDKELRKKLAPLKGKPFMVFHPSWGYFADEYGLEQEAIEVEGKEPSAKQLAHILEEAKEENIKVIFVQPQFSKKSAKSIAREIGGSVVAVDPLAYDYVANLHKVADIISKALSVQK